MVKSELVEVLDQQQAKTLLIHPKLALHLACSYHTRFRILDLHIIKKEITNMARLATKSPVLYQKKFTLEEIEGQELTCVSIEEKEGTSGIYMLLRVKTPKGDTGYISMGFKPIVEALQKLDYKKDLPGELRFVKSGSSWIME